MPLMQMAHAEDPKQEVRDRVGDVSEIRLFANRILVGIYERPKVTRGGIHLADQTRDEDIYQGKIGLILSMGPIAFVDDEKTTFHEKAKVGDWVLFRTAETWALDVNSKQGHCRMIDDVDVRAVIQEPDKVW